jgi:small subunit ribosomal protein S6
MPLYESVFIARQDIATTQVDALGEQFTKIIEGLEGKVTKREYWGLRNLAFRIKKNRKGHYVLLNVDASAAAVNEMERNMRINEDVLRYLTVKVEEHDPNQSPILQRDRERDRDRDGRDGRTGWDERSAAEAAGGRRRFGDDRPRRFDDDRPPRRFGDLAGKAAAIAAAAAASVAAPAEPAVPAARGDPSSGGARAARSRGRTRPRSTSRT